MYYEKKKMCHIKEYKEFVFKHYLILYHKVSNV